MTTSRPIAASGTLEQELARVRAAQLLVETSTYPDMLTRLESSTAPGATFRHTARELLALSAWRANDTTSARKWLDMIANDGETPPGLALARRSTAGVAAAGCKKLTTEKELSEKSTMRLSQRLIAATVLDRAVRRAGRLWRWWHQQLGSHRYAGLARHQEKAAGRIASRFSPKAFPASSRACQRNCTRARIQQQIDQQNAQAAAAAPPPEEPKQAAETRARRTSRRPPPARPARPIPTRRPMPVPRVRQRAPPRRRRDPKPKKIVRKRTTAPPPDQQDAQPASSGAQPSATTAQQQSAAPFPAPMPSNTFSH